MNKKTQLISKNLYKRNLASFYGIACLFGQFDEKINIWNFRSFEILIQKTMREMIPLLNHRGNFLYSIGSKFLIQDASHICMKWSCKKTC
jgi:hypothetical protein